MKRRDFIIGAITLALNVLIMGVAIVVEGGVFD